jgi:hypothetical protein
MYEKFDVYFGDVKYREKVGGKSRPTIIIDVNSIHNDFVYVFGVYTYRKWFADSENARKLYEIKDTELAGLDRNRRSFVDLSRLVDNKTEELNTYKHLGHLSERDIIGLSEKMGESGGLEHEISKFLKSLDLDT